MKCYIVKDVKSGLFYRGCLSPDFPDLFSKERAEKLIEDFKGRPIPRLLPAREGVLQQWDSVEPGNYELVAVKCQLVELPEPAALKGRNFRYRFVYSEGFGDWEELWLPEAWSQEMIEDYMEYLEHYLGPHRAPSWSGFEWERIGDAPKV